MKSGWKVKIVLSRLDLIARYWVYGSIFSSNLVDWKAFDRALAAGEEALYKCQQPK